MLWRRSVAETAQRTAAQLLALGRLELASSPSRALAYAIASLGTADNLPARRFAVEALWHGPPALLLSDPTTLPLGLAWSPDGSQLALGGHGGLVLVDGETGERRQLSSVNERSWAITSDSRRLLTHAGAPPRTLNVWNLTDGRLERTITYADGEIAQPVGDCVQTWFVEADGSWLFRSLPLDGSAPEVLGRWRPPPDWAAWTVDATGTWWITVEGGRIVQRPLADLAAPGRLIGTHEGAYDVFAWTLRDRAISVDRPDSGPTTARIWNLPGARLERELSIPGFSMPMDIDPLGRFFAAGATGTRTGSLTLFDLDAPHGAEPNLLEGSYVLSLGWTKLFSPDGSWLARVTAGTVTLWSMAAPRSTALPRQSPDTDFLTFTPGGDLLLLARNAVLELWPVSPADEAGLRELWSRPGASTNSPIGLDPAGRVAVVADSSGRVNVVPLDGSTATVYELDLGPDVGIGMGALSPDGRLVAVSVSSQADPDANAIRILDLETGSERTLDTHPEDSERCAEAGSSGDGVARPLWLPDGRLVSDGDGGLRLWDLVAGASHRLQGCRSPSNWLPNLLATPDSRMILRSEVETFDAVQAVTSFSAFDLATGEEREITSHGNRVGVFAVDSSGTALVTGDQDGVVRVGQVSGDQPHLLFGHTAPLAWVAVSPDGRRIASIDDDGNIRLWPMPDLSKPPLHTLPHDELVAKLESLTNLRAVPDPGSDSGWTIEIGPFPGWATVPEWQP
jgi:WD40 repeat protein